MDQTELVDKYLPTNFSVPSILEEGLKYENLTDLLEVLNTPTSNSTEIQTPTPPSPLTNRQKFALETKQKIEKKVTLDVKQRIQVQGRFRAQRFVTHFAESAVAKFAAEAEASAENQAVKNLFQLYETVYPTTPATIELGGNRPIKKTSASSPRSLLADYHPAEDPPQDATFHEKIQVLRDLVNKRVEDCLTQPHFTLSVDLRAFRLLLVHSLVAGERTVGGVLLKASASRKL